MVCLWIFGFIPIGITSISRRSSAAITSGWAPQIDFRTPTGSHRVLRLRLMGTVCLGLTWMRPHSGSKRRAREGTGGVRVARPPANGCDPYRGRRTISRCAPNNERVPVGVGERFRVAERFVDSPHSGEGFWFCIPKGLCPLAGGRAQRLPPVGRPK